MPSSQSGGGVISHFSVETTTCSLGHSSRLTRKASDDSIRTELCEGLLYDVPARPVEDDGNEASASVEVSDRNELIERLKRGESPTWKPKMKPKKANDSQPVPDIFRASDTEAGGTWQHHEPIHEGDLMDIGMSIQRPRSALHSGVFTEPNECDEEAIARAQMKTPTALSIRAAPPSISTSPETDSCLFSAMEGFPTPLSIPRLTHDTFRQRSLTSSYSSSFAYMPPTSPLAYSELNIDSQLSDTDDGFTASRRRHTFQHISSPTTPSGFHYGCESLPRRPSYQFQAHQPQRSFDASRSFSFNETNSLQASFRRARRPSLSDPSIKATMVGSYEESILHGRMSTPPSKPLEFVAQIGVLGLGNCKKNLKCPPHVSVPFPAVFYSYQSTGHGRPTKNEDGPSPYVGQIDLEHSLPHTELSVTEKSHDEQRKRQSVSTLAALDTGTKIEHNVEQTERLARRRRRKESSMRAPPGGSYRIPEKGQVQIIIKNPNKTAVKLFLVPYDLANMEPGTKTFIRQRSYSAGPIVEMAGTGSQAQHISVDKNAKTLRYLAHLHICCPSKGRFYLYKSIKVVFANRVPDGKEKLQNQVQYPEPRFSPYRPERESAHSSGAVSPESTVAPWLKRRSEIFPMDIDAMGGVLATAASPPWPRQHLTRSVSGISNGYGDMLHGLDGSSDSRSLIRHPPRAIVPRARYTSPSGQESRPQSSLDFNSSSPWSTTLPSHDTYDRLTAGDIGRRSATPMPVNEGLLARKLKDFTWDGGERAEAGDDQ